MGRVAINRSAPSTEAGALPRAAGPLPPVLLDLLVVLVFAGAGRIAHDESFTPAGLWTTAWPLLIGLAGGYLGVLLTRWPPASLRGGAMVAGKTLVLGLVVRYGIQRHGMPLTFVIVAVVVLGGLMFGWRLLAARRAVAA